MGVGGQPHAPAGLPDTHCTGRWVGTSTILHSCRKFRPDQESIHGPPIPKGVATQTEISRSAPAL